MNKGGQRKIKSDVGEKRKIKSGIKKRKVRK